MLENILKPQGRPGCPDEKGANLAFNQLLWSFFRGNTVINLMCAATHFHKIIADTRFSSEHWFSGRNMKMKYSFRLVTITVITSIFTIWCWGALIAATLVR